LSTEYRNAGGQQAVIASGPQFLTHPLFLHGGRSRSLA
jgi:hypothetical protein